MLYRIVIAMARTHDPGHTISIFRVKCNTTWLSRRPSLLQLFFVVVVGWAISKCLSTTPHPVRGQVGCILLVHYSMIVLKPAIFWVNDSCEIFLSTTAYPYLFNPGETIGFLYYNCLPAGFDPQPGRFPGSCGERSFSGSLQWDFHRSRCPTNGKVKPDNTLNWIIPKRIIPKAR